MRIIDADALIEKFNEKASIAEALMDETTAERFRIFCLLADAVEQMPTVDAVPVIRCKDCDLWDDDPDTYGLSSGVKGMCKKTFETMVEDDFCSYGKRKEDK